MSFPLNERVQCSACPIRHRAICARCEDDELAELEQIKVYRSFEPGAPILWRGDDLVCFSSLVEGIASLTKSMEDGRTQMVGRLLPSDFIGRPGRERVEFDVTSTSKVTLCCFKRQPFEELILRIPHLAQRLLEMALDELDAAREWMVRLGRKKAREKIATFLEMLARRSVQTGTTAQVVPLPLTREEAANFLGLTLETVSRQMSILKKDGVIQFPNRKHFEVIDFAGLHDAMGDDSDGGIIV